MYSVVPFKEEHLTEMLKQKINKAEREMCIAKDLRERAHTSFTGMFKDKPMVCGGVVDYEDGIGYLWTVFDERSSKCFQSVFGSIKDFIKKVKPNYANLMLAIPCDFEQGKRRAELLGFRLLHERAVKFLSNGTDCSIYVMKGGS